MPAATPSATPNHRNSPERLENSSDIDGDSRLDSMLPIVENESFSAFLDRAVGAIQDRFPDEELDVAFSRLTRKPRRRSYKNQNEEWNTTIRSCMKDLEKSTRVSFLLTLNSSHKPYLLRYYAQQFPFEGPMKTYMLDMGEKRIQQNCATWKYRITERLISHVRELMANDVRFKAMTIKKRIIKYFKRKFSLETFVTVFDFVKGWVDIGACSERVHKWCKTIYVELASDAKLHVNWQEQPDSARLAKSNYTRKGLTTRISSAAGSAGWAALVPNIDEIILCEKVAAAKPKNASSEFLKPDEDKDFYVPGLSDSDDDD